MSRRARPLTAWAWLGAAAGSTAIHALAVFALVQGGADGSPRPRAGGALAIETDWIDVFPEVFPEVLPDGLPNLLPAIDIDRPLARPAVPEVAPAPQRDSPEGDREHHPAQAVAPRIADGRDRRTPAADKGERAGRTTEGAWRRDRSTLHARLSDGAAVSQPSRLDTSSRSASPQSVRREPVIGARDSIRTNVPANEPSAAQRAAQDESAPADSARSAPGEPAAERVLAELDFRRRAETAVSVRGVGPLDTDLGARSFDGEAHGAVGDNRSRRAASNETRPGVTDFSRAGVRARDDALSGRGPGDAPGAVDRPSAGRGPSEYGAASAQRVGDQVSDNTQDRRYQLYIQEIARRINTFREFPRRLALRLEQGETVVRFVLEKDGHIRSGVQVMKSSGFDEFDSAATRAVERAAPFPPMPDILSAHPLPVSVRVAFENPLVR